MTPRKGRVTCPHCGATFRIEGARVVTEPPDDLGWPVETPVVVRTGILGRFPGVVIGHYQGRIRVRYRRDGRLRYTTVTPEALERENPGKRQYPHTL